MAEHDRTQPQSVSKLLANYFRMTAPREGESSNPRSSRRPERQQPTRPPIDNRGLSLEEGNDFA
jgi:hypothetical protein